MATESYDNSGDETGPLFGEFSVPSYEDWRKSLDKVLKGAPFEKRLVTKTYEGIDLQPLYRLEDIKSLPHLDTLPGLTPYLRSTELLGYTGRPWEVCQEIPYATPEAFNLALRADRERGQNAVHLAPDRATRQGLDADRAPAEAVGDGGVSISSVEDLAQALDGVDLETTPIHVQAGHAALPLTALLVALVRQQGKHPDRLRGSIGLDPLGALAREGTLPGSVESGYDQMARLTAWAAEHTPGLQTIMVQGHPYHDGGGSAVQELAFALATGVEYLREMQARGLAIDTGAPRMRFAFSIGSQFFMEVAKLRAARLLWARIVNAFGGNPASQKMALHGRTATWNKTVLDPYVNMLRATVEALAGVMGGCHSLHVSPFDEVIRIPDEFSRRIARNTHTILREEGRVARTVDPAGGSWYVESLTDAVARAAWALFQDVEKQGGMRKALQVGFPQEQVAQVAAQRAASLARRKDILVGTNMYPNLKEQPLEVTRVDRLALQRERAAQLESYRAALDADWHKGALERLAADGAGLLEAAIQAAGGGATVGELTAALRGQDSAGPALTPIAIQRGAQPFEALRAAAEAYRTRTGARPKVFLANLGPVSQHKARADFAAGFVETGGFEAVYSPGFASPQEAAQAALDSGAPAVVICSTDATYPELVPPLVKAVKAARPEVTVLLAGYPADQVEAHKAAGIDDFIYLGSNGYEMLVKLQKKVGVNP